MVVSTRPAPEVDQTSDEALIEIGFRYVLNDAPTQELIFLSIHHGPSNAIDPPLPLRDRLADLKLMTKPVSDMQFRGFEGVFDRQSDNRGHVYWALIKDRVSPTRHAGDAVGIGFAGDFEVQSRS